jgi:hypothetical protein
VKDLQIAILSADFILVFFDIHGPESAKLSIKNKWVPLIKKLCQDNKKEMVDIYLFEPISNSFGSQRLV